MEGFDDVGEFLDYMDFVVEEIQERAVKRYIRDAENPLEFFNDKEFRRRYKFRKKTVLVCCHGFHFVFKVYEDMERSEARSKPTEGIVGVETPTAMSKRRNRRSIAVASVSKETNARLQKLHQATEQQELLFNLRKQILEEELQRAAAKKKAELEFQKAAEILDQKLKKEIEKKAALKKNQNHKFDKPQQVEEN
ncbi:hypothetical protein FQA39_LY09781 [Lamprigera yunnana]|nr:hypothetical protein FQA39_LY09781 [Lamprigera yunnana]